MGVSCKKWEYRLWHQPSGAGQRACPTGRLNLQLFNQQEDKTEEATPHRRREARKRGQVMKSMEMNSAVNMLGMIFFFVVFWRYFYDGLTDMLSHYLRHFMNLGVDPASMSSLAQFSLEQFLMLTVPFLAVAFFLGLLANVMQVGFLVSTEVIKPQANRLNPVEGFKKIFSRRSLFEMVKAVLKVVIVGAVSYLYLREELPVLLLLLGQEIGVITSLTGQVIMGLGFRVAGVFLFLALLDFIYQRYEHNKNLKMSRREVKDEYKQLEGDPYIRSKQRERQRAISQERSIAEVPDATVVVTNPTEIAVALKYNEKEDHAPVVVAKGAGRLAQQIREVARDHEIPIIQNPPVARVLFAQAELGEEIPMDLYQAVAEILAMVYRLQEKGRQRRRSMGA